MVKGIGMQKLIKVKLYIYMVLAVVFTVGDLVYGGTCTSISRTNASANSVLTSTKYNADLNTLYTNHNSFDGGCVASNSLEADALDSTSFSFLNKGIHQGCKVTKSNDSTISVDKCHLSVDGNFVSTSAANTESFGCSGCSAEASQTVYYAFAKSDSDGTTLNLLISTSAPNADGFDGSSNKVLARFYNDASSNIDAYSIDQWATNGFISSDTNWTSYTPTAGSGFGTISNESGFWRRVGDSIEVRVRFTMGTVTTGSAQVDLPDGLKLDFNKIESSGNRGHLGSAIRIAGTNAHGDQYMNVLSDGSTPGSVFLSYISASQTAIAFTDVNGWFATGDTVTLQFVAPIKGWSGER